MDWNNILTLAGVFVGAAVAAYVGYSKKWGQPAKADPVLTGVGLELGNRAQMDMLISAVNRVGDILENKKQASLEDMLKDIKDDMGAMKEHPSRRR